MSSLRTSSFAEAFRLMLANRTTISTAHSLNFDNQWWAISDLLENAIESVRRVTATVEITTHVADVKELPSNFLVRAFPKAKRGHKESELEVRGRSGAE